MDANNIESALAYYNAFEKKDLGAIARHLHPDVQFVAPMGESRGREAVVEAAKRLIPLVERIDVRAKFASGDQVALVYDMHLTGPVKICPTAVLMTFKNDLIARTELYYDARPFGNL
ncbi:MAG TPA: nuclear transport factor 2 family protein [Candidatus Acidoferrales bacterium]|nr:nuclear transport factor 2 family protein [Candidatus Acidoferrales bacterium]